MRILGFLAGLLALMALAAVAIAGPQRMLKPDWFGFVEIDANIFGPAEMTDTAEADAIAAVEAGEAAVAAFFGTPSPRPIIVLCPSDGCDALFGGSGARGMAYGSRVIRLGEGGINAEIAAHELMHTALKARVGEWRSALGAVPAWFDEGLAVIVSGDTRFDGEASAAVLADLRARPGWWQWGEIIAAHGWRAAYTGARQMVGEIEAEIGRDGILRLIGRMAEGEDFGVALEMESS